LDQAEQQIHRQQREIARLQQEAERLRKELEAALRAGKRHAAGIRAARQNRTQSGQTAKRADSIRKRLSAIANDAYKGAISCRPPMQWEPAAYGWGRKR
jgi:cell division septum initiation protein DivIVA